MLLQSVAGILLSMMVPGKGVYETKDFYYDRFLNRAVQSALNSNPAQIDHLIADVQFPESRLSLVGELLQAARDSGSLSLLNATR